MKTYTKENIKEAANTPDGIEYTFEFVDCGKLYRIIQVNYEGKTYSKTESEYTDIRTGANLDTYYADDEYLVRNLDGTLERA